MVATPSTTSTFTSLVESSSFVSAAWAAWLMSMSS